MSLRERFRALFSPRRQWLGVDAPVVQAGGWLGPLEVVVPRALCSYRRLAFPQLPSDRRAEALALAASRAAPEAGSGWTARWQDEVAHLWVFPPSARDAIDPAAVPVAESALLQLPEEPDVDRLVALVEGVEGQVWRGGQLLATRWWHSPPSGEAWAQFLRSASVEPRTPLPDPVLGALSEVPWGRPVQRIVWSAAQLERAFWRGLVVFLGVLIGWQVSAAAAWSIAEAWQASRLEALRAESAPLIDAREKAEAARTRMEALINLAAAPSDYVLVAEVKQRLPEDARLVGWLRDPASLRVAVRTRERDPRVFVQAFSGHPLLGAVQANAVERGADVELLFDLDPPDLEGEG